MKDFEALTYNVCPKALKCPRGSSNTTLCSGCWRWFDVKCKLLQSGTVPCVPTFCLPDITQVKKSPRFSFPYLQLRKLDEVFQLFGKFSDVSKL